MTQNAVTLFADDGQLPAHLVEMDLGTNIVGRDTANTLSFKGKVWRSVVGGEENLVIGPDGEPRASVGVIVLDYNKKRSRAYYPGAFVEGQNASPICWSNDSEKPDANVKEPQSPTCASCKWSVKGSKTTTDGTISKSTACAPYKRVAVVPLEKVTHPILLLKVPQTSMWDADNKENEAKNFYAFDQYLDMLKKRGIPHTAHVVTKIKFDHRTAYPKLLFGAVAFLPNELTADVRAQLNKKEEIEKLLSTMPDLGTQEAAPTPEEFAPAAQAAPALAPVPQTVVAAPVAPAPVAAAPAAPVPTPARTTPRPAAKPKPVLVAAPLADPPPANGATIDAPVAAPAAAASVGQSVPVSRAPASNPGLESLLAGWDDK